MFFAALDISPEAIEYSHIVSNEMKDNKEYSKIRRILDSRLSLGFMVCTAACTQAGLTDIPVNFPRTLFL